MINWTIVEKKTRQYLVAGDKRSPQILISRLLLRMRRMYVASIRLDFHEECMENTERTLITRVWTFCRSSDHVYFDHLWRESFAKRSAGAKAFWPSIVVARTP